MRSQQLVVCSPDNWIANQLRELAHDRKVLLYEVQHVHAARRLLENGYFTVFVLQIEAASVSTPVLELVGDVSFLGSQVRTIIVIDTKLNEDDQFMWTVSLFEIGTELVLFPPLTRTILEDAVGELLDAM